MTRNIEAITIRRCDDGTLELEGDWPELAAISDELLVTADYGFHRDGDRIEFTLDHGVAAVYRLTGEKYQVNRNVIELERAA